MTTDFAQDGMPAEVFGHDYPTLTDGQPGPSSPEMVPARVCGHLVPRPRRGPVAAWCADCKRDRERHRLREYRIRKRVRQSPGDRRG